MKKVNLRDLYPNVYKTDHFVEVTEERSLKFLFYHFGLFQRQSALCHCKDGKAFSGLVALLNAYRRPGSF